MSRHFQMRSRLSAKAKRPQLRRRRKAESAGALTSIPGQPTRPKRRHLRVVQIEFLPQNPLDTETLLADMQALPDQSWHLMRAMQRLGDEDVWDAYRHFRRHLDGLLLTIFSVAQSSPHYRSIILRLLLLREDWKCIKDALSILGDVPAADRTPHDKILQQIAWQQQAAVAPISRSPLCRIYSATPVNIVAGRVVQQSPRKNDIFHM